MKRLRDVLIVIVLGGVLIWWLLGFISGVHKSYVNMSPVVTKAESACIEDGVICHAGCDSFQSEESAALYLKSPEHLAAVKEREERKAQQKIEDEFTKCLVKAKGRKQMQDCERLKAKAQVGASVQ